MCRCAGAGAPRGRPPLPACPCPLPARLPACPPARALHCTVEPLPHARARGVRRPPRRGVLGAAHRARRLPPAQVHPLRPHRQPHARRAPLVPLRGHAIPQGQQGIDLGRRCRPPAPRGVVAAKARRKDGGGRHVGVTAPLDTEWGGRGGVCPRDSPALTARCLTVGRAVCAARRGRGAARRERLGQGRERRRARADRARGGRVGGHVLVVPPDARLDPHVLDAGDVRHDAQAADRAQPRRPDVRREPAALRRPARGR